MNTAPLSEFLRHLGAASAQASALALVVWAASRALGSHLAPRWRCGLWGLVVLRLAWPFRIPSPVSLFNLWSIPRRFAPADWLPKYLPDELSNAADAWLNRSWVCWIWLTVAIFLSLRLASAWLWSVWIRWTAHPVRSWPVWHLHETCKAIAEVDSNVTVGESTLVSSPCLVGLLRPRLLIPRGFHEKVSLDDLKLIFLHELGHLRRCDIAINWVLAAVEIFHWFNPLVWLASGELRAAREEACDVYALDAYSDPSARRTYGEILLKLVESEPLVSEPPDPRLSAAMSGNHGPGISRLTHRLRVIAGYRPGARTWIVGACTWLALACIGLTDAEMPAIMEGAENPTRPEFGQDSDQRANSRALPAKSPREPKASHAPIRSTVPLKTGIDTP